MWGIFTTLIVLITVSSISITITGNADLNPELGPTFVDSYQKKGPVYVEYDSCIFYFTRIFYIKLILIQNFDI
jgi:hypothetical protein